LSTYALNGAHWDKTIVTWYFDGEAAYLDDIAAAFDAWDNVIALDFDTATRAADADIFLTFDSLDGPYSTLGVTSYSYSLPSFAFGEATITFDSDETYTYSAASGGYVLPGGQTFYELALHEIGHAIGLDHVYESSVIMYPYINGSATDLTADDIAGGQALYGEEASTAGWTIAWAFDWHVDWSYGWYSEWSYGWHSKWLYGWHSDWAYG
jgi:predicted Zn-dependent protease